MKPLPLLIFILISVRGFTQTLDSTINTLLVNKVIDSSMVADVKNRLSNSTIENSSVIDALSYAEMVKQIGRKNIPSLETFVSSNDSLPKEKIDEIRLRNTEYLHALYKCGLMTKKVRDSLEKKINTGPPLHKLLILLSVRVLSSLYEKNSPENLIAFADKLRSNQLLTDEKYNEVKSSILSSKIQSGTEMINYCAYARLFDVTQYSNDPAVYLEQIHREVSEIFPGLTFTDFSFKIVKDTILSDSAYQSFNVIVSLKSNGRIYRQKSFISTKNLIKYDYLGKIDISEFYQIFNKILADAQSPYRLHNIGITAMGGGTTEGADYRRFGIIALKKEQTKMFDTYPSYIHISYENFKNTFTTEKINSIISEYSRLGLFKHLSQEQIKSSSEEVASETIKNKNDIIFRFPGIVATFDFKLQTDENPYVEITQDLAKVSHGVFNPINISDNFKFPVNKTINFMFTLDGKVYSKQLKRENFWIDPTFLDLINQAAEENNIGGKFYELYGDDEGVVIFLTEEQRKYLKENKLLSFGEEGESEE